MNTTAVTLLVEDYLTSDMSYRELIRRADIFNVSESDIVDAVIAEMGRMDSIENLLGDDYSA